MVSVVLHNACLKMEEAGNPVEEIVSTKGIHRWLGRSGIALGGAASLMVGAVFGGVLESVPVLLPPPAAASSTPTVVNGLPASTPLTLAADAVPAAATAAVQLPPAIGAPAGSRFNSVPTPLASDPVTSTPLVSQVTQATQSVTGDPSTTVGGTGSGTKSDTDPPATTTSNLGQDVTSAVQSVTAAVTGSTGTGGVSNVVHAVSSTVTALTSPLTSGASGSSSSGNSSTSSGLGHTITTVVGSLGL